MQPFTFSYIADTASPSGFFGAAICYRVMNGRIQFLIVPYTTRNGEKQTRIPGGTKKQDDSDPADAAVRELLEETSLITNRDKLQMVYQDLKSDGHLKAFFLVHDFQGEPAKFEGKNLLEPETGAPQWWSAQELTMELYNGHRQAMEKAIEVLSGNPEHPEYREMLRGIHFIVSVAVNRKH